MGDLQPDDVLHRATLAGRTLQSAEFSLRGEYETKEATPSEGTLEADGHMLNGGKQIESTISLKMKRGTAMDLAVAGEVIALGEGEVYIRPTVFSMTPPTTMFDVHSMAGLLNRWLKLPSTEGLPISDVSPDPQLLAMQSSVVRVVRDRGLEEINDRDAYHYDVVIDQDKLRVFLEEIARQRGEEYDNAQMEAYLSTLNMTGQLWIDAEEFFVHRLIWDISATAPEESHLNLAMTLSKHNEAFTNEPPADFVNFPATGSGAASSGSTDIRGDWQEQFMQSVLQGR